MSPLGGYGRIFLEPCIINMLWTKRVQSLSSNLRTFFKEKISFLGDKGVFSYFLCKCTNTSTSRLKSKINIIVKGGH